VVDADAAGGQAGRSSGVDYLGFPDGISGGELVERATTQARKLGTRIIVPAEAVGLGGGDGSFRIEVADGAPLIGRSVIIATGTRYRRLSIPDPSKFEGVSVHYAATQREAQLCRGDPVVLFGGGGSAGLAALLLSRHVRRLTLVVREDDLQVSMASALADRVAEQPNVDLAAHSEVRELNGDGALEAVVVEDTEDGKRRTIAARALFVLIGAEPHTGWLRGTVALDDDGYVRTGQDAASPRGEAENVGGGPPQLLETSLPGVFAAGDVRSGSLQQVAAAVGDGALAIRQVRELLVNRR
jgi:thioredoxin reductase (NADPH)